MRKLKKKTIVSEKFDLVVEYIFDDEPIDGKSYLVRASAMGKFSYYVWRNRERFPTEQELLQSFKTFTVFKHFYEEFAIIEYINK